jgi:hypothetical protein
MKELKPVYHAVSKEQAEVELDNQELNWDERLIYTTNTVEGYHRPIR